MATWKIGCWLVGEPAPGRLEILQYTGREEYVRVPDSFAGETAVKVVEDLQNAESAELAGRVDSIGANAFRNRRMLRGVILPEGVWNVSSSAFSGCTALETVHLPESVRLIGAGCFAHCESLREIWLPEGLTQIPEHCFEGCIRLSEINLQFVIRIGAQAFSGCRRLDRSCVSVSALRREMLEPGAFRDCTALADEDGFAVIDHMLVGCISDAEIVEVPEDVTVLDSGCFMNLPMREVVFPEDLREIRSGIFENCDALQRVTAPGGVTALGGSVLDEAIDTATPALVVFEKDEIDWAPFAVEGPGDFLVREMQKILPRNGYSMRFSLENGTVRVLRYLGNAEQPRIPDVWKGYPVTEIGPYAFAGVNLAHVSLPKHLERIGAGAFMANDRLKGVVLNRGLRCVDAYAFANCPALTGVMFEDGLEELNEGAFSGCTRMRYAVLPQSTQRIAPDALEPQVLVAGVPDSTAHAFALQTHREFVDSEHDLETLALRVASDRYASYHSFVSGTVINPNRWELGGEVE